MTTPDKGVNRGDYILIAKPEFFNDPETTKLLGQFLAIAGRVDAVEDLGVQDMPDGYPGQLTQLRLDMPI